jgi:hypothetical protein
MTQVSAQPARIPLVDPNTGLITREWMRFFEAMFIRVGGTHGQSNDELTIDMHDDSGIEEIKLDQYRLRDELNQLPPVQMPYIGPDDTSPSGRIEALEAEIFWLRKEIEAIQQGAQI